MKISKERQLFDNRALVALIIPLIIEQFLAVLVDGRFYYGGECRGGGSVWRILG